MQLKYFFGGVIRYLPFEDNGSPIFRETQKHGETREIKMRATEEKKYGLLPWQKFSSQRECVDYGGVAEVGKEPRARKHERRRT